MYGTIARIIEFELTIAINRFVVKALATFRAQTWPTAPSWHPISKNVKKKGKILTLSLGGAIANVGFDSDAQAAGFEKTIWDMFLGMALS